MRLDVQVIGSELKKTTDSSNKSTLSTLEDELQNKRDVVFNGWGDKYRKRTHDKGKLTSLERIHRLIDDDAPIHPVGTLVNWGRQFQVGKNLREAPGAGVFTLFSKVNNKWVMIIANDNTVASGSWWPKTPEKIQRAQEMARKLRIPVIYLVDCSGLFLPEQSLSFPGKTGAGHIFHMNAILSSEGIPQIAGVFGDCIAGGGYMPIISDRVFMTEQAYMVIAGAALIKGAKSLQLTSLDIGGPEVHVHQSGCADDRVPDDETCVDFIRNEIAKLPGSAIEYYRYGGSQQEPLFNSQEICDIFPEDHRHSYDIKDIVSRLVDGSLFHEFMPHTGKEILTGIAKISGLWVGIASNVLEPQPHPSREGHRPGGILYREGIAKLASFSRACSDDGIPLFWLQDISGFDIGIEAEAQGLLGYGSSLIYSNATTKTPVFTVLLRKASGAGYYAMHGLPYEPIVQLSTCLTRQSVMEGRTLAIATYNTKLDDDYEIITNDPTERAAIELGMAQTAARIEKDMDPVKSAAQMDTDEIIQMNELRPWLCALAEMSYQSIGHRRIKNPRIWSIHDYNVLAQQNNVPTEDKTGQSITPITDDIPEGYNAITAHMEGSFWAKPAPDKPPFKNIGDHITVGEVIGLIEVMKTFTPVRSAVDGSLEKWLIEEGGAISIGQTICLIK
jgi:3-methylcrotonyl-CoA carboxylase beta subunit